MTERPPVTAHAKKMLAMFALQQLAQPCLALMAAAAPVAAERYFRTFVAACESVLSRDYPEILAKIDAESAANEMLRAELPTWPGWRKP